MAIRSLPAQGADWTGWATDLDTEARTIAGKADANDPRLTDQRVPTNGSVTDVKVATNAAINADKLADGTTNKLLTATERTKLSGVATGATANSTDAQLRDRSTHTGTQSADTIIDGTTNHTFTAADDTKLSGIAAGATANSTDATLLARANHTGTQSADTLTDGATNKAFLATERTKLTGIATGATANSADATLLARANHTGTQAATTITGLATVATSGAYADLTGKPAIPAVSYLNAADYGFLTGNTAAANNTAITSAISAAVTAGKPLYIPGYGSGTPYLVSAPIAHPGGIRIFGDPGKTFINNTLNTSALITCTGSSGQIADLSLKHTTTLDASTGNGIEVNNVDSWTFERVQVYSCGWGFRQTGGSFFSNYLVGMNIMWFWAGAIYLTGGTGSQWNNTYINNYNGTTGASCTDSMVRLEQLDESVFNQLNIEWCAPTGQALLCNGSRTINVNSLHIERVNMTQFDSQLIRGFGVTGLIIDALTVKFCDIAPTGSSGGGRTLIGSGSGAKIDIRGLTAEANSNTNAQAAKLAATDADAGGRIRITAIRNDVFTTASTGIGLRGIDDPMFVTKAGALTTTDLPYSGMIGVDTTNSRLYVNVAGTVKSVVVA